MDKSQILKGFNEHFTEFVEDIERVFPDDNDIATVKAAFVQMRKANPKLIIKAPVFPCFTSGCFSII